MNLSALSDFNLVATHGGFGKASRVSGRPKATLSRRVMDLEESLGVRLLERGARTFRLTEEGKVLRARTEGLLVEIDEVRKSLSTGHMSARGTLRVSCPLLFAHVAMGRLAAQFIARYPQVEIEVTTEDRSVDLVEENYDVVIRINPRPDSELVGRCFLRDRMLVVAAPSVKRPRTGATVPAVLLTSMREPGAWRVRDGRKVEREWLPAGVLRLSSILMVRDAAVAGAGAALLPHSLVRNDLAQGRLVNWGEIVQGGVEGWVLHTSRRLVSSKVAAFVQFLCDAFPDGDAGLMLGDGNAAGGLGSVDR